MAVIPCVCPPRADGTARHPDGDTVKLKPTLDFRDARAARYSVIILKQEDELASVPDILAAMTEQYLLGGIESWTRVDDKGKPLPVTRSTIRAFMVEHPEAADLVGDEADELYTGRVLRPLVTAAQSSLPPTQTSASTSQKAGTRRNRKPSRPSSITTIPMAGTEKMSASRDGDYR